MTPGRLVPLQVRAHLATGIAHSGPWTIALDGLLAGEMWAEQKALRQEAGLPPISVRDLATPPDLELPLARCAIDPGAWHWAATCGQPEGRPQRSMPDVRQWTGRTDHRTVEQVATDIPKVLSDRQGRYRARAMPLLVTTCRSVLWRAVGDPEGIRRILDLIPAIGKKRGVGEGHVLAWEVTPLDEADPWATGHLHSDGSLGRPSPAACLASQSGIVDGGAGTAGLRPPYMHRGRQHHLRLPVLVDQ